MVTGYEHDQHEFMKSMAISLHKIAEQLIILNQKLDTLNDTAAHMWAQG